MRGIRAGVGVESTDQPQRAANMKTKPSKASKPVKRSVPLKDLKARKNPKGGLINSDGDPDGPLIP